jgi:hypothetical protein
MPHNNEQVIQQWEQETAAEYFDRVQDYEVSGFYFAEVTETGVIVNGNHRLTALMQLGYTHAEVEIC